MKFSHFTVGSHDFYKIFVPPKFRSALVEANPLVTELGESRV